MASMTIEELEARQDEIRARMKDIDVEWEGRSLPDAVRGEWNALGEERDSNDSLIEELKARKTVISNLDGRDGHTENEARSSFNTRKPGVVTGDAVFDLTTMSARWGDPQAGAKEFRDRAMRAIDSSVSVEARGKERIEKLLDRDASFDMFEAMPSYDVNFLARRILITGNPDYKRAFTKTIAGKNLSDVEQRALSLGSGAAGGFAVVYELDPTIVPTSNFSVNPFRGVARVETLTGTNEWKAITSGAITAAYSAEATQSSDNAPTLAQPDLIVDKAQAFVPFSIELGQDWGALVSEMAQLLQDAKDDLEATKFAVGAGHGSFEPKGVITGATATTTAGGVASFAIADLYKLLEALPPRFRPRAQWMANLFIVDKIRQFDTAGGSGVWIDALGNGTRGLGPIAGGEVAGADMVPMTPKLLGRNFWESTAMASALTTASKIAIIGDWRYFVIIDRVGMDIEILPQLLGANQRPTGQRGLYAYWRNTSDVLSASAFQVLVTG